MDKHHVVTSVVGLSLLSLVAVILYVVSNVSGIAEQASVSDSHVAASAASLEALMSVEERLIEKGLDGPIAIVGELKIVIMDDAENGKPRFQHFLHNKELNAVYKIKSKGKISDKFKAGDTVKVKGNASGNEIQLAEAGDGSGGDGIALVEAAAIAPVEYDRSVIAIPSNSPGCTPEQIEETLFSETQESVRTAFAEASNGKMSIHGVVLPETTIEYAGPTGNLDTDTAYLDWAYDLNQYAASLGHDVTDYDNVLYILPYHGYYQAGGFAELNDPRAWVMFCDIPTMYMHEMGHNFGFHHASRGSSEYGDGSSVMGSVNYSQPYRYYFGDYNAPNKDQGDWLPGVALKELPAPTGTHTLSPLDYSVASVPNPQVLKFPKPDTNEFYYVSYRVPEGISEHMGGHAYRVFVHTYPGEGSIQTQSITSLASGDTYTDAANGFTVTVNSSGGTVATVSFETGCSLGASITTDPQTQYSTSAGSVMYDIEVTNQQYPGCSPEEYSVSATPPEAGWNTSVSLPTQTMLPGQTVSGVLTVTPPSDYDVAASPLEQFLVGLTVESSSQGVVAESDVFYVVDAISPESPTNLTGEYISKEKRVILRWNPVPEDFDEDITYNIYRNGILADSKAGSVYSDWSPQGGSYVYTVSAVDVAGNESAESGSVTVQVKGKGGGGSTDDGGSDGGGGTKCTPGAQKKGEC